jgi:mxaA protein
MNPSKFQYSKNQYRLNQYRLVHILLAVIFTFICANNALANDPPSPDIPAGIVKMTTIEPKRDVGYTVGDILERTIILEVKNPYKLVPTTLPIVGYERRFKGQVTGIELRKINYSKVEDKNSTTHTMHLAYQVFTNSPTAKFVFLPAEIFKFTSAKTGELVQYRVPEWLFRVSPLAVYGSVKIEEDMSTFRGPFLLNDKIEKQRLTILLAIFGVSLLGLLYILGMRAWLPLMGKPFARSFREVRKLPATVEGLQQAVASVHQALNTTAGNSVFGGTLDTFLANKPAFAPIKADIELFFGLSRQVFFEPQAAHEAGKEPIVWLRGFIRICRDCERGLTPESSVKTNAIKAESARYEL